MDRSVSNSVTLGSYGAFGTACLASCDHSHFPSWGRISGHGGGFTCMFVPASSVGVRCCYHFLTTGRRPDATSRSHELLNRSGFEEWLLGSSSPRHDTDHGPALVVHVDRLSGGQANLSALRGVRDHHAEGSRRSSETTPISRMQFHITYHCSFGHALQWQHVSNIRRSIVANDYPLVQG
jgi:hypothetical protein